MTDNVDSPGTSQERRGRQVARRVARPRAAVQDAVILADISESMNDRDGVAGGGEMLPPRRIDRLARVLDYVLTRFRISALYCFNDLPVEIPLVGRIGLPKPGGSTALATALEHVGSLVPRPARVIVVSDGMPNSVPDALHVARLLRPMVIDAYYVGPEALQGAMSFMADLAASGGPGGRSGHFDLVDPVLLGGEIERRLLAGPKR